MKSIENSLEGGHLLQNSFLSEELDKGMAGCALVSTNSKTVVMASASDYLEDVSDDDLDLVLESDESVSPIKKVDEESISAPQIVEEIKNILGIQNGSLETENELEEKVRANEESEMDDAVEKNCVVSQNHNINVCNISVDNDQVQHPTIFSNGNESHEETIVSSTLDHCNSSLNTKRSEESPTKCDSTQEDSTDTVSGTKNIACGSTEEDSQNKLLISINNEDKVHSEDQCLISQSTNLSESPVEWTVVDFVETSEDESSAQSKINKNPNEIVTNAEYHLECDGSRKRAACTSDGNEQFKKQKLDVDPSNLPEEKTLKRSLPVTEINETKRSKSTVEIDVQNSDNMLGSSGNSTIETSCMNKLQKCDHIEGDPSLKGNVIIEAIDEKRSKNKESESKCDVFLQVGSNDEEPSSTEDLSVKEINDNFKVTTSDTNLNRGQDNESDNEKSNQNEKILEAKKDVVVSDLSSELNNAENNPAASTEPECQSSENADAEAIKKQEIPVPDEKRKTGVKIIKAHKTSDPNQSNANCDADDQNLSGTQDKPLLTENNSTKGYSENLNVELIENKNETENEEIVSNNDKYSLNTEKLQNSSSDHVNEEERMSSAIKTQVLNDDQKQLISGEQLGDRASENASNKIILEQKISDLNEKDKICGISSRVLNGDQGKLLCNVNDADRKPNETDSNESQDDDKEREQSIIDENKKIEKSTDIACTKLSIIKGTLTVEQEVLSGIAITDKVLEKGLTSDLLGKELSENELDKESADVDSSSNSFENNGLNQEMKTCEASTSFGLDIKGQFLRKSTDTKEIVDEKQFDEKKPFVNKDHLLNLENIKKDENKADDIDNNQYLSREIKSLAEKFETPEDSVPVTKSSSYSLPVLKKSLQKKPKLMSNLDLAIERVVEKSRRHTEKSVPILTKFHKDKLRKMTRVDLEEAIVLKVCEAIADRSELGQLRLRVQNLEQNNELWRKKAIQFEKQNRELEMVLKRFLTESAQIKRDSQNKVPLPIKVTRSVGLQVVLASAVNGGALIASKSKLSLDSSKNQSKPSTSQSRLQNNQQPQRHPQVLLPKRPEKEPAKELQKRMPFSPPLRPSTTVNPTSSRGKEMPKQVVKNNNPSTSLTSSTASSRPSTSGTHLQTKSSSAPSTPQPITPKISTPINIAPKPNSNTMTPQKEKSKLTKDTEVIDLTDREEKSKGLSQAQTAGPGSIRVAPSTQVCFVQQSPASAPAQPMYALVQKPGQRQQFYVATTSASSPLTGLSPQRVMAMTPRPSNAITALPMFRSGGGQIIPVQTTPVNVRPQNSGNTPVQQVPQAIRMQPQIKVLTHPAPLPTVSQPVLRIGTSAPPPMPTLKIAKTVNGIMLSWSMHLTKELADMASYQLYAYQEASQPPSTSLWKKVGDVKALPLPMACTLTQFIEGHKYHFAVRAVDIHGRIGPFSNPGSILLRNEK